MEVHLVNRPSSLVSLRHATDFALCWDSHSGALSTRRVADGIGKKRERERDQSTESRSKRERGRAV